MTRQHQVSIKSALIGIGLIGVVLGLVLAFEAMRKDAAERALVGAQKRALDGIRATYTLSNSARPYISRIDFRKSRVNDEWIHEHFTQGWGWRVRQIDCRQTVLSKDAVSHLHSQVPDCVVLPPQGD
jgi:hypothetical protein